jgi:hypothetical protein
MGLGFWGWPDHPQGPRGGFGHPLRPVGGGRSHPQALDHPQNCKPIFPSFFFLAFRGGRTTPKGLGWLRPPPYGRYGVADHPLAKNGVVGPPHFLGMEPPRFLSPFFFFLFNFLFLNLKKKIKKKILKCSKLCSFEAKGSLDNLPPKGS